MRDIEFRAWDKRRTIMFTSMTDDGNPVALLNDKGIIPMQYIGIKDKNGKKIFEGDIIKTHFSFTHEVEQEPFVVVWNIDKAMFEGVKPYKRKDEYLKGFDFLAEQKNLYEVIGNIHEKEKHNAKK